MIALVYALAALPKDSPRPSESFDFLGVLMMSPGLALFLYGVSSIPAEGKVGTPKVLVPAPLSGAGYPMLHPSPVRAVPGYP